ncbi:MAG: ArsA family ATPase [Desulfovibrio sp.]|jgi:arsenite-transporting ATPase|nr:ArsA family ATPase [Desulfovibrio sp.]
MQRYYFHAGKGGVGKSTTSSLVALNLARTGREVLLVSLDPAHNQSDIFDMEFGAKPRRVAPGLRVAQADIDDWIRVYLRGIEDQIRRTYTYHAAFNLGSRLNVIKHSPGLEEYALLLAFKHYRDKHPDPDVIVYDMPPTALTMKFFNLPALSLIWLDQLLELRREIMEKKRIITKIHMGVCEVECDKISSRLGRQREFFTELREVFQDGERCRIHLVVNPDRLSFAEAGRICTGLDEMSIPLAAVLMNKVAPESVWDREHELFRRTRVHPLPLSPDPLIGLPVLEAYLDEHGGGTGGVFSFIGE